MPLMKVEYQNWNADFAYAPPTESAVINTDEILRVTPKESRGEGPWVLVEFSDGKSMICLGRVDDFLKGTER